MLSGASAAVLGRSAEIQLGLWHGLTPALVLSAISLAGGVGAYAGRGRLRATAVRWDGRSRWNPEGWYEGALEWLDSLAVGLTRRLQSGYLRHYLLITLASTVGVGAYTLISRSWLVEPANWSDVQVHEAVLVALILLAVLVAVLMQSRLSAIAALGVVGYGVALVFRALRAPDLALTQFLVETLTVILFVLVFYHLPASRIVSGPAVRGRDIGIAATVGLLMTSLVIVAGEVSHYPSISDYFFAHSLVQAHGRNVVNVLLVDFRAVDTLGEITVLSVAAFGVYALLKLRPREDDGKVVRTAEQAYEAAAGNGSMGAEAGPTATAHAGQPGGTGTSESREERRPESFLILRTTTRFMLPLLLLFSLFLLLRGHNEPGGGFSGGLVAAAAFALYGFAFGAGEARHVLTVDPRSLIGAGLLVAVGSGSLGLVAGQPFMTALWAPDNLPGLGKLGLGTPLLFDVGVYLVVVGVVLTIILSLAEE